MVKIKHKKSRRQRRHQEEEVDLAAVLKFVRSLDITPEMIALVEHPPEGWTFDRVASERFIRASMGGKTIAFRHGDLLVAIAPPILKGMGHKFSLSERGKPPIDKQVQEVFRAFCPDKTAPGEGYGRLSSAVHWFA